MPSTELSDILTDLGNYQAEYKPVPPSEQPATCELPDAIPGAIQTRGLPPIGLDVDCSFSFIPIPITVVPFVPPIIIDDVVFPCSAGFTFGGELCFQIGGIDVDSDHNTVGLTPQPDGCGANLTGCINLELPEAFCPNGLSFGGQATISVNGIPVVDDQGHTQAITLTEDADNCGANLGGNINIKIPDLICPNGFNFRGAATLSVNGIVVKDNQNQPQTIELTEDTDGCGGNLNGNINIKIPDLLCPNGFSFGGGIVFQVNGIPVADNTVTVTERSDGCGGTIGGHINFEVPDLLCPSGFTFDGGVTMRINGVEASNNTIQLVERTDGCGATLTGDINLDIPQTLCVNGFSFAGESQFKVNGQDPLRSDNSRTGQSISLAENQDGCGAQIAGNLNLDRVPIYRRNWFPGLRYFPYDMVTYFVGTDSTCTALSLTEHIANSGNDPSGSSGDWVTLGCDGTSNEDPTPTDTEPKKRHPYEVIKLAENKVTIHAMSALMKELDTTITYDIRGLDERFTLKKDDLVYLELIFDARNNALPVLKANIAKGRRWDNWDQTLDGAGHPNHTGIWPKLYKFLKPNDVNNATTDNYVAIDGETSKFIDQKDIATITQEIKDYLFKIGSSNTLAGQGFNGTNRLFKMYMLIGYVIDDEGGDFNFTDGQTKRGFVQLLKNHLLLQGNTINDVPSLVPMPYPGPYKRQIPKPSVAATPLGNDQFEMTIVYVDPKNEILDPRIYYTDDGTDPWLTDMTTPKLTAKIYDKTQKPVVAGNVKFKCFCVKPPYISSALFTSAPASTLQPPQPGQ